MAQALFPAAPAEREAAPQPLLVGFVTALGVATVAFGIYTLPLQAWAQRSLDLLQ